MADTADINPRFLILPSPVPSLGLMIKSIAVQELMMPSEVLPSEEQPPQEVMRAVEQCLDTVRIQCLYIVTMYTYMCILCAYYVCRHDNDRFYIFACRTTKTFVTRKRLRIM